MCSTNRGFSSFQFSLVQFSSVQDGIYIYALRKAPSLRSFPNVAFETVPMFVWVTMALSRPFKGRSSSAFSFHASLLQAIDGVMSLALCPRVVSQAPQHFRSSEKQAWCAWGLHCPPAYLLGHFPSLRHVQGSTPTGGFEGECRPLTHSSQGFSFHFSLFVASSLNL